MYKFYCDLCGYESKGKAKLTFKQQTSYTSYVYNQLNRVDLEICQECSKSFEKWTKSRKLLGEDNGKRKEI